MTHDPLRDLPMTTSPIDREGPERARPGRLEALLAEPDTRVVDLVGGRARLGEDGSLVLRPPTPEDGDTLLLHLGRHGGVEYLAACRPGPDRDAESREEQLEEAPFVSLRKVAGDLPEVEAALLATAVGLANWHHHHPRCPRCGGPTEVVESGWVRRCPQDESEHHPRIDPAIIVAVTDADDRLLLARNAAWPEGRFSVLAGFVEPGETIAGAVAREVAEETSVEVADVRFVADQPWPFPSSLMLGCVARAESTDLVPQPGEIAEARWFTREAFAAGVSEGSITPAGRLSIAARLVEQWLGRRLDHLTGSAVRSR